MATEVRTSSAEHISRAEFMEAHAEGFARDLVNALGGGDYEKGLEMWIQKGYRDHFRRLLDSRDPELYKSMIDGYILPILSMLEQAGEVRKKDLQRELVIERPVDKVLVADLKAQLGNRFSRAEQAAAIGIGVALGTVLALVGPDLISHHDNKNFKGERGKEVEKDRSKIVFDYDRLAQLDSSATPEILIKMEQTWPKGFTDGSISFVGFRDKKLYSDPSYGLGRTENAATANGGEGNLGTDIIFWRGMQGPSISTTFMGKEIIWWRAEIDDNSSEEIWDTILHEGGHAIDWIRSGNLTASEREELKNKVYARIQADDRYKSDYVEDITNKDKDIELSTKAIEYWAEIVEAYLKADPNLPEADAKIVAKYIAKDDPSFDRDKALQARLGIFQEMRQMKIIRGFKNLSPLMHDRYQSWLIQHHGEGGGVVDIAKQKIGRAELVSFLRSDFTKEEREFAISYVNFCKWREELLAVYKPTTLETDELKKRISPIEVWNILLFKAKYVEGLAKTLDSQRKEEIINKIDAIISEFDLDIGNFRGGTISEDEKQSLFPASGKIDLDILLATDWEGSLVGRLAKDFPIIQK